MSEYFKRTGPRPLWLHLNAGAAMMASLSDTQNMFGASAQILQEALDGIKAYQISDIQPFNRPYITLMEHEGSRFLTAQEWQGKPYVILIPSLINSYRIFDLKETHSLAQTLAEQGFAPIILEWAKPESDMTLEKYISYHLKPLLEKLIAKGRPIAGCLGYCMGATILTGLLCAYPGFQKILGKMIFMAPPWDFSHFTPEQRLRLNGLALTAKALPNPVPFDFVQSLFWAIDPLQVLTKFRKFNTLDYKDRFIHVEDWLNEDHAVSRSVILTCLQDWFGRNSLIKGEWRLNNVVINPADINAKMLVISATKDKIVPPRSAHFLIKNNSNMQALEIDTGHIGLMAGTHAKEKVWIEIAQFLK